MKIFQIQNNYNYTAKCDKCPSLLKFNIDINNLIISGECKNGHSFNNITSLQLIDLIKNTYYSKNYCYKCQSKIDENFQNFICLNCNKLFCKNCIKIHSKEKNNEKNTFNNGLRSCTKHNMSKIFFCNNCKINICEECKLSHISHCIIPFFDIIPENKKKNAIKIEEYKKLIEKILKNLVEKKKEIDKRYNQLNNFLNCLLFLNEKLLKKFNYSIFDYYNYHNFHLFTDYQNKELYSDKILNYMLFGTNLDDIKESNSLIKNANNNNYINEGIDNFNICNYQNLKYLKENIFFLYEQKDGKTIIKFFEYKNFAFKLYFQKSLGNCDKIDFIKIGKYNNLFIITRGKRNKIFVIKYNIIDKNVLLEKIYDPYHKTEFYDIIDIKDDNYVISDKKGLKIFYNFYKPENIIKNIKESNYTSLNNINNNMFLSEYLNKDYNIFNSEKYEIIKVIHFPIGFKFISTINNELIIFSKKFNIFYIYDIKYFEIVIKLDYLKINKSIAINNIGIYEFLFDKGNIEIKKFNFKEGNFNYLTKIIKIQKDINQKNIKYIDNSYIILAEEDELQIYYF